MYCTTVGSTFIAAGAGYPANPSDHPPKYLFRWDLGRIFDEYALLYITRGKGTFKTEGERTYRVGPGSMILLFPEIWHWYAPDQNSGWDENWVGFKGDYADRLVSSGFFSPMEPVLDIGLHDFVLQSFHQIFDCARAEQPGCQQVLGAKIYGLLADSSRLSRHHDPISEDERLVERAKFLLADNITEQMDIGWLSRSLGIGYSRFRTMFKNHTGLSPYQYFLNLKMGLAKQLLEQGNYSIKEISHMLSFDDPYYFSHLFKKKTGLAPSRWTPIEGAGELPEQVS